MTSATLFSLNLINLSYALLPCGGWLVKRHPAGFWYASSDYIGMDTCYTCWIEECLTTNCLGCKRGNYPDRKWIDLKKSYQEEDK